MTGTVLMLTPVVLGVFMLVEAAAQTPAPAVVVSAETIEATMKASIENNTLDTKMNETPIKGGIFRVGVVHRTAPETRALLHDDLTEVYQIIQGAGTLVTGGTAQEARPVSDPPNLGPTPSYYVTQVGGVSQRVKARDIVVIPAGLPHRFSALDGPIDYVIYRFESTAK